jgi:hypothetical protein
MKTNVMVLFLFLAWNYSMAQTKNDAATLITTDQINQLLGVKVGDSKSIMGSKYCEHHSADFKSKVVVQYTAFSTSKAAADMLKMAYDENNKDITAGKKAVGIFTAIKTFSSAGPGAYYLTSPGNEYSPGHLVRLQFVLGTAMFSFETTGIEMDKVIAKLDDIFKIIKGNYKI